VLVVKIYLIQLCLTLTVRIVWQHVFARNCIQIFSKTVFIVTVGEWCLEYLVIYVLSHIVAIKLILVFSFGLFTHLFTNIVLFIYLFIYLLLYLLELD